MTQFFVGLRAAELHGNLTQRQRAEAVTRFKSGDVNFLIATDLAARGLDVEGVLAVINMAMPRDHRTCVCCGKWSTMQQRRYDQMHRLDSRVYVADCMCCVVVAAADGADGADGDDDDDNDDDGLQIHSSGWTNSSSWAEWAQYNFSWRKGTCCLTCCHEKPRRSQLIARCREPTRAVLRYEKPPSPEQCRVSMASTYRRRRKRPFSHHER